MSQILGVRVRLIDLDFRKFDKFGFFLTRFEPWEKLKAFFAFLPKFCIEKAKQQI